MPLASLSLHQAEQSGLLRYGGWVQADVMKRMVERARRRKEPFAQRVLQNKFYSKRMLKHSVIKHS